jgi:hypothetical protein
MISSIRTSTPVYLIESASVRRLRIRLESGAVADLTPSQARTRDRFETLIGVMAPGLSLVLAAGDRISRIVQPEDFDYYPVRPLGEWEPRPADISPEPRE